MAILAGLGMIIGAAGQVAFVGAAAAATTAGAQGGSWQYNPAPAVLSNAITNQVQGYRQGDGCAIPFADTLQPGSTPVEHQILAVQASTCAMLVQMGTPSSSIAPPPSPGFSSGSAGDSGSVPASSGGADPTAWIHGWYVDPIGLEVNGLVDYVNWSYNGSCVTSSSAGANWAWDGGTGWYVKSNSWTTAGSGCSYVNSQSNMTFENDHFCLGFISTYTYYNPFWIHGNYNGTATVRGVLSNSGLCGHILYPDITDGFGSPPGP